MMMGTRRIYILLVVGVLAVFLLGAAAFLIRPYSFKGSVIQPASAAPDFTLPGGQDSSFHLTNQHGKVVLVFYGFTHCTDACPATMGVLKQVKTRLSSRAKDLQVVFITVDPRRDTPEVSEKYATTFDPSFMGLSGTEAQLQPVWQAYGVYRDVPANPTSDDYEVNHSTFLYAIDPSGNLRETFTLGTSADDIVQDVIHLLSGQ